MRVVLIRHATRSTNAHASQHAVYERDPPLNAIGTSQADELAQSFLNHQGLLPLPTHLFASPKKRAINTLQPISLATHVPLSIDARLDERHPGESSQSFLERARSLLADIEKLGAVPPASSSHTICVYLCSHSDWLEAALMNFSSDDDEIDSAASWMTAEYRVYKVEGGVWSMKQKGRANG